MKRAAIASLGFLAIASAAELPVDIRAGNPALECREQGASTFYFPANTFRADFDGADFFKRTWYSRILAAMGEPSLTCELGQADEVIRLLWLRAFHDPISIRVERTGDIYRLTAAFAKGQGSFTLGQGIEGFSPDPLDRFFETDLSREQWSSLLAGLNQLHFWEMATENAENGGFDGSQWVIERRQKVDYHIVDRWNGEDGVKDVGLIFLDLARLKFSADEVY